LPFSAFVTTISPDSIRGLIILLTFTFDILSLRLISVTVNFPEQVFKSMGDIFERSFNFVPNKEEPFELRGNFVTLKLGI